jgi:hypothetical protein
MFPRREKQDASFMENVMSLGLNKSRNSNRLLSDEQPDIKEIAGKYLMFSAMYELKNDMSYTAYDTNLNHDLMTWKSYETQNRTNSFGLTEFFINLEDVVLSGTSDSSQKMARTVPRFQVRLDKEKTEYDAFESCKNDQFVEGIQ